MTKIANPGFTKKFDSCADMLYSAGADIPADMVVTACSPDFGNYQAD
jgi:hypothetical protein